MIDILADRERAVRVGRAGMAHMREHFSVEHMVDAYEKLYRTALKPVHPL